MTIPDGMYEVAERFPPLAERVPEWSIDRLLSEYGRPLANDWMVGTTERDEIILAELLRKDLTVYQLWQLLDRPRASSTTSNVRHYEGGMVVRLVARAGKSKQFEAVLRDEIVKAKEKPTEVLGNMLASLRPVMDVDVSELAIECVGVHWYASSQAFRYLENRAHSISIYNALRERMVSKNLMEEKERVLSIIQKRLNQP